MTKPIYRKTNFLILLLLLSLLLLNCTVWGSHCSH